MSETAPEAGNDMEDVTAGDQVHDTLSELRNPDDTANPTTPEERGEQGGPGQG